MHERKRGIRLASQQQTTKVYFYFILYLQSKRRFEFGLGAIFARNNSILIIILQKSPYYAWNDVLRARRKRSEGQQQ
jgi:hypothetical protein